MFEEVRKLARRNVREYGMYIAFIAIVAFFSIWTKGVFLSPENIGNMINQVAYIAVLTVGMTMVIIVRNIDLSVGFVAGFTGALCAYFLKFMGLNVWVTIVLILLIGLVIGLYHGFLVAKVGVPAFVVTLSSMFLFQGLLKAVTVNTGTISLDRDTYVAFYAMANGYLPAIASIKVSETVQLHLLTVLIGVAGIAAYILGQVRARANKRKYNFEVSSTPIFVVQMVAVSVVIGFLTWQLAAGKGLGWSAVIVAIVVAIFSFILTKMPLGRYIYGVGGNPEAAQLSGVSVTKITLFTFAAMSALAALSGMLFTSRLSSANTTAGVGFELDAIAAAFVGGASPAGGVGKITGSIIGALVIHSLTTGMRLKGVGIEYQYIIKGIIVVLAVVFDLTSRRRAAK